VVVERTSQVNRGRRIRPAERKHLTTGLVTLLCMTTSTFTPLKMTAESMAEALAERPTAAMVRITTHLPGGTEQRDVYLLHWRPLAETIAAFTRVIHTGDFTHDLTVFDMANPSTGPIRAQRLLVGFGRQGIHFDRPPRCREHSHPLASHCPISPERRVGVPGLPDPVGWPGTGQPRDAVPWLLSSDGITAVPAQRSPAPTAARAGRPS
jgi:hypothetical protein